MTREQFKNSWQRRLGLTLCWVVPIVIWPLAIAVSSFDFDPSSRLSYSESKHREKMQQFAAVIIGLIPVAVWLSYLIIPWIVMGPKEKKRPFLVRSPTDKHAENKTSEPITTSPAIPLPPVPQTHEATEPGSGSTFSSTVGDEPSAPSTSNKLHTPKRRNYFVRHWRGELSLGTSYWVNGFFVNILLAIVVRVGAGLQEPVSLKIIAAMFIVMYVGSLALSVWQIVGTWRSATSHVQRGGLKVWATLAQICLLLATLKVGSTAANSMLPQTVEFWNILCGDKQFPAYRIQVLPGGKQVEFTGGLRVGSAEALEDVLRVNPQAKVLRLNSGGGRIREAVAMGRLVRERGLNTYTTEHCLSAATVVFIAGKQRVMAQGAKLGFHAGRFPGMTDKQLQSGNEQIRQSMVSAGIAPSFINRALATPNSSMWYPSVEELQVAGVITGGDDNPEWWGDITIEEGLDLVPLWDKPEDPPPFKRVLLPYGISIDAPTTWIGFSPEMKAQIETATQAVADLSGLDYDTRQLSQLLDIHQPFTNTYARLILSVSLGERLTQAQVKTLTTAKLQELESDYRKNIETIAKQMTLDITEWRPLERRDINDRTYFLVRYLRSSPNPGQSSYVEMYQLHDTDKSVNFSIEYWLADKVLWDSVCRRSLTSLHVGSREQKQERLAVFRSPAHKFEISYPADWQPLPKLGGRMVVHVGGRIGEHTASMNAIVSEDESFRVMKTEDYLKTVKQKDFLDIALMSMSDLKMHRWETKYEVGGQAALMFIYSGILDGQRQSTLTAQIIKDGRLYTVAFNAPAEDFPVIYLELKHILDSFRFTK